MNINGLIQKVLAAAYTNIEDVLKFVEPYIFTLTSILSIAWQLYIVSLKESRYLRSHCPYRYIDDSWSTSNQQTKILG